MIRNTILYLAKQLYPKGRAFRMPKQGVSEAMNKGLALSEERAYNFAKDILNSILPDNDNFTEEDALLWEKRLFIVVAANVSLDDRKAAILRKMRHPGDILARQHFLYLEGQLQLAGFNVYVHEYVSGVIPASALLNEVQHGNISFGQAQHGQSPANIVANYSDENKDKYFSIIDLKTSFFIGAAIYPSVANVPLNRKIEIRELILKLKPANMSAILLIDFI